MNRKKRKFTEKENRESERESERAHGVLLWRAIFTHI